ncbi:TonB-dependent receptor [Pseudoalteromonas denitrificans]|uniref:Iron complex outermembrane recepter protein n=1 Tax=Pseudoalteromonas denitrificans DSM 6059 TaxID=1123010 RepID=A0A1I1N5D5_9GAMM|nr:TonB-dependent receptor [Pseudoalteromonas denitrificans]SFC92904.1 iron complex outermembrane recepter protein [Pseudoalteromonas denitrificans DSM 6059]
MNKKITSYLTLCILSALHSSAIAAQSGEQVIEEEIETIEVRGIRGSLTQALNTKRFEDSVMDSISAEDIGKFPDKNIGDALQRVPGVTVTRGYSEVDGVTIRGTAPQHSLVLLNGQNVASVGWFDLAKFNRSFNFEMLSAEQVSGLDVYKSVEADINEGAMGGTVNLKTRKPLDMAANTIFASAENGYSELAKEWSPSISGLYSWKNDNENFGVLVAHSVEKQRVVRETLRTFGPAGPKDADTLGNIPIAPGAMSSILFDEARQRDSSQITLQYVATEQLDFSLDYNKFVLDNNHINTALYAIPALNGVYDGEKSIVNDKGVTTRATSIPKLNDANHVPLFNNTMLRTPKMEMDVVNFTVDYAGDTWELHTVVGQSTAKSRGMQTSTWWGNLKDKSKTGVTFDIAGPLELIPTDPTYVNDHSQLQLYNEFSLLNNVRDNEINYYQADLSFDLDLGIFTMLETGVKYQEQMFSAQKDLFDGGNNTGPLLINAMSEGLTLADFNGGHVSGLHSKEGRSGSLTSFAIMDKSLWDYALANKQSKVVSEAFSIEEEITAAYVKGTFSGDAFRGNIGLRVVDTNVLSKGTADGGPAQQTESYANILPSVNLVADLKDDLLFRFAAGSTVSRPDYDQVKMAASVQSELKTATVGNPDVKPYKSDQYDVGLEWYFNASSLIGGTVFHKNISDYIYQTDAREAFSGCGENCLVTRYRNVSTAEVTGVELQYQQAFDNGFGLQVNYTYTDSSVISPAGKEEMLDKVSKNSANISGYYENEIFSTRLAFNVRDEWQEGTDAIAQSYQQLDASFVWHATDNIDVSVEAVNILNEALVIKRPESGFTSQVDEFGARYFVGASIRF